QLSAQEREPAIGEKDRLLRLANQGGCASRELARSEIARPFGKFFALAQREFQTCDASIRSKCTDGCEDLCPDSPGEPMWRRGPALKRSVESGLLRVRIRR